METLVVREKPIPIRTVISRYGVEIVTIANTIIMSHEEFMKLAEAWTKYYYTTEEETMVEKCQP